MTIRDFGPAEQERLVQIVAQEFPVFILGPGCFRVGFDDSRNEGWKELQRRVADLMAGLDEPAATYLREFYLSKLSDERRTSRASENARLNTMLKDARARRKEAENAAHGGHEPTSSDFAEWRTSLAEQILKALRHATCLLGVAIAEGKWPVLSWQHVSVFTNDVAPTPTTADAAPSAPSSQGAFEVAIDPNAHSRDCKDAIQAAARVAGAIANLAEGQHLSDEQVEAVDGLPLVTRDLADPNHPIPKQFFDASWKAASVLLPQRLASLLGVLLDRCFNTVSEPLRGSNVEWLSDLLWHVLASDAEVQPSQAELAFYASLSDQGQDRPEDLRRPRYGDRSAEHLDMTRLVEFSQPTFENQPRSRKELLRTTAQCLLAQHRIVAYADRVRAAARSQGVEYPQSDRWVTKAMDLLVLALETDYGYQLERALVDLLDNESDLFHVILPVWMWRATSQRKRIAWLFGTMHKGRLDEPPTVSWEWLEDAERARGPIVIKLNGCARMPLNASELSGAVSGNDQLENPMNRYSDGRIERALLYDEHDRLTAMQSFEDLIHSKDSTGLVSTLSDQDKGLSWSGRSWVIMGHGFADWIPRLGIFSQNWSCEKNVKSIAATSEHWAFDRSFDWPERALLTSLGVSMFKGDLASVGRTLGPRIRNTEFNDQVGKNFVYWFTRLLEGAR